MVAGLKVQRTRMTMWRSKQGTNLKMMMMIPLAGVDTQETLAILHRLILDQVH